MAGLLAWAADVVGGNQGKDGDGDGHESIPIVYTAEQQRYALELDQRAASLSRAIQDLRLRLPPPDISQRLPHLHAHSLASNAALALQLNSHSATRHQAQLREVTLQDENAAYEKAISSCEGKIQEKMQEAELLLRKLEELEETEKTLRVELGNAQAALKAGQSDRIEESTGGSIKTFESGRDTAASKSDILDGLENKKKELSSIEERVRVLERQWTQVQDNALKQPSQVQREKILDKQLHSLIEQLAAKQAQAEGLVSEIHLKEMELESLNGLWRRLESSNVEANAARNRFGRSTSEKGYAVSDYIVEPHHKGGPYPNGGRNESHQRLMLLRSSFVLYILVLHILVFIKISF